MATIDLTFKEAGSTAVYIGQELPAPEALCAAAGGWEKTGALFVADTNTAPIAQKLCEGTGARLCVLEPGEARKNWQTVEKILGAAQEAGLGRDALFAGVGGGVITDLTGFAASIYKRGVRLAFVSTSLLGMVDAAVGGKTGFDLFGIKNMAGTFYPASCVYMPLQTLRTLPSGELHSGYAELIKTLLLDEQNDDDTTFRLLKQAKTEAGLARLEELVCAAVRFKGRIAAADPYDTDDRRALLNLGHTFGHALEAAAGLGKLTHGEAVAWGIACSCELGVQRGITPPPRAAAIRALLAETGYEIRSPHPALSSAQIFMNALLQDKKKSGADFKFIVPAERGARVIGIKQNELALIENIVFKNGKA